jgi:hypothetical protein
MMKSNSYIFYWSDFFFLFELIKEKKSHFLQNNKSFLREENGIAPLTKAH